MERGEGSMQRRNGKAVSMPAGLTLGALTGLAVTILGSMILAKMMDAEWIGEERIGYGVMGMLLLASYLTAAISFGKIKRRRLLVCLCSGGIYFGILLSMTALLFGGEYSGVGVTALLIACGVILAILPGFQQRRGGKRPKIKIPNG